MAQLKLVETTPVQPNNDGVWIMVRTTIEHEWMDDPETAYAYAERQQQNSGARVQIIRRHRVERAFDYLIMDELRKRPEGTVVRAADFHPLVDKWRYSRTSIWTVLARLAKEGHLRRVSKGLYTLGGGA